MWSSGVVTTETLYRREGWSEWLPLLAMARELESDAQSPSDVSVPPRRKGQPTVSVLRVVLLLGGLFALIPLTSFLGLFGFIGGLFFLLLVAFARA